MTRGHTGSPVSERGCIGTLDAPRRERAPARLRPQPIDRLRVGGGSGACPRRAEYRVHAVAALSGAASVCAAAWRSRGATSQRYERRRIVVARGNEPNGSNVGAPPADLRARGGRTGRGTIGSNAVAAARCLRVSGGGWGRGTTALRCKRFIPRSSSLPRDGPSGPKGGRGFGLTGLRRRAMRLELSARRRRTLGSGGCRTRGSPAL